MTKKNNLSENLKKLKEVSDWFDNQEDIDVEEGLNKVKEAVRIIKESKERLREIENEFEDVKKELEEDEK
jgi:KaiC/GvpD/RAD55 family RecA-like ATPase